MSKRRFTPTQVQVIRDRAAGGENKRLIAMEYGVGTETIARICRGDTYGNVVRSAGESAQRVAQLIGGEQAGIAIRPTEMMLEAQAQANGKAMPSAELMREFRREGGNGGAVPPIPEALKALAKTAPRGVFGKVADEGEPDRELPPGVYNIPEGLNEIKKD